ncbi:MAG TPA: HAD-IIIC family phosphatase [Stellaceae bacterium]|nr:HAD-IIIC family phosphatase [Stellaceae bacterium]
MIELDWLPTHSGLAQAITAARALPAAERMTAAIALAGCRRDALATLRIDKLVQDDGGAPGLPDGFQRRRLAVMASSTVEHLVPGIRVAALARRLLLDIDIAPYGQFRQAILDRDSFLEAAPPDFVLFMLDEAAALAPLSVSATRAETDAAIKAEIDGLAALWRRARERFGAVVLQQTVLNTRLPLFGNYEAAVPGAPAALIDRFNQALAEAAASAGVLLVDIDREAASSGRASWSDPVRWYQAKQAIGPAVAPVYGDLVARVIAAACGLSRKCLVVDLDNTLWGGVVGDDGIEGIVLGQGSAAGEAYLAFQRYAGMLADRGIVLAVCSKNDPDFIETVFAKHPEMHLKRDSVAAFAVNWDDKATNLRRLAKTLELGLDSFVFVDDNPAERAIVRRELPSVAVPELPDDVALYGSVIARAGYFEAAAFTKEDRIRVRQYAENVRRNEQLANATDMEGFLRSLEMTMEAGPPRREDITRVTQLINKTNQFNLTTRRYTEPEVQRLVDDPSSVVLRFRLTDRFGDNGLIAVIIALPHPEERQALLIDTWLMSCRVLGRGVEAACLGVLARAAAKTGATTLIGLYRPSGRNAMVREHYLRLGFLPEREEPAGSTSWRLNLASFVAPSSFIRIVE